MSDIRSVLSLLCRHLNLSIDVSLKPEHFRSAKFNDSTNDIIETLWTVLDILSFHVMREKQLDVDFQEYETLSAVKLSFAYLQYPAMEFYGLDANSKNSRQLLLAVAWLLGTQDVLNIVVKHNLVNGVLGQECSSLKMVENKELKDFSMGSLSSQAHSILHLNGKVNYNLREISELLSEKAKLVDKVHVASTNASGLPHLSVSEVALLKRICTINKDAYSEEDREKLRELSKLGSLLEMHLKWMKKEHIFFEWMVTVIQEEKKSVNVSSSSINCEEISRFISLLRHILKQRTAASSSKDASDKCQIYKGDCPSRLLRTQSSDTEASHWLAEASTLLSQESEELSKKREILSKELKEILRLIPSCVQV